MIIINNGTKKAQWIIDTVRCYAGRDLSDVYTTYSYRKAQAYRNCLDMCINENGYNFHISSFNSNIFVVSWETETAYRVETAYNSYILYK